MLVQVGCRLATFGYNAKCVLSCSDAKRDIAERHCRET